MLGIVFTGGEGPEPQTVRRLLDGPARGALTVAADSGLELAEAAGLRPDWITGDMDSLSGRERLQTYPPRRVMYHPADKDCTDTELALSLLWEKGCDRIWIAGGGGGRVDHLFGIRSLFERERFPCRWIGAAEDIYCIEASRGKNAASGQTLCMTLNAGALVSVFPLGEGWPDTAGGCAWKASSCGLKWPLDNVAWSRGFFGLSNIALNGEFTITAERGRFMVIIPFRYD
ncbi:MAG: thiamine diphosphokinase [Treponema sp.]|nr:thiamine diphosphokinase [Treponema sp.]